MVVERKTKSYIVVIGWRAVLVASGAANRGFRVSAEMRIESRGEWRAYLIAEQPPSILPAFREGGRASAK